MVLGSFCGGPPQWRVHPSARGVCIRTSSFAAAELNAQIPLSPDVLVVNGGLENVVVWLGGVPPFWCSSWTVLLGPEMW